MKRGHEPRSDARLLRDHSRGDQTAFSELFARHRNKLWGVALRTTGDYDDAADALQEALISIHKTAGRFRSDSSVSSWMHRIVLNASLDRLRRDRHHTTQQLSEFEDVLIDPRDHHGSVDLSLSIGRALDVLPLDQRAAVIVVDVYGHSMAEAAEILGIPTGTVKSRCSRGREKLALVLAHLKDGD